MKIDNTVNVKYTVDVGRCNMDDLTKKVMEAEQKLFDTCPKMRDPDWWENGSDDLKVDSSYLDKTFDEVLEKARKLA